MNRKKVDVILISDIHLGADYSHANELMEMLESYKFQKLILVGDVFQHGNFDRLHKMDRLHRAHWKVLSLFRKLTDPEIGVEVIWIEGNHDWKVLDIIGAILGVRIFDEYIWESNNKKFMAIHGHQFDLQLPKAEFLNKFGQNVYLLLQRYFHKRMTRIKSMLSQKFSRSPEYVRNGAMAYARDKSCDYVFCGHTHRPEVVSRVVDSKTIRYFNCGTWADGEKLTYVTITNGEVNLEEFPYDKGSVKKASYAAQKTKKVAKGKRGA